MKTLLIGSNDQDKQLIQDALGSEPGKALQLETSPSLKLALEHVQKSNIDVIVADTVLSDPQELDALERLKVKAVDVPIILLIQKEDEAYAIEALRKGIQDYLVKGDLDSKQILRAIRHSMIRQHAFSELRALSTIDDLTGLYNRRGFMSLAKQQIKAAERSKREMILLLADLDLFKQINDTWGHQEGDVALMEVAKIFRDTFRTTDLIARLGGDEFVVLAPEAQISHGCLLTARLENQLANWNASFGARYQLAFSWGCVHFVPGRGLTLERLIQDADKQLYQQKREKYPDPETHEVRRS